MKTTVRTFLDKRLIIAAGVAVATLLLLLFVFFRDDSRTITTKQLEILIKKDLIRESRLKEGYLYVKTAKYIYKIPQEAVDMKKFASVYPVEYAKNYGYTVITLIIFIIGIFLILYLFMSRRSRNDELVIMKSPEGTVLHNTEAVAEKIEPIVSNVTFRDVAGMKDTKEELSELVDFLKNPSKYTKIDIRLPKGVLLAGPPGVGKTHIAKAVAGEVGVPFFYQSGASIVEIYVGMGAKKVHELFEEARKNAPSVIFIDEIDAIGRVRGSMGNDEREATLNQLLTEMDGFDSDSAVLVIAATNRVEMLDAALLRPGRFDRRVHIPLPDRDDRAEILNLYLKNKRHHADISKLAVMTVGFSSAALSTLVNEAALHAMRDGRKEIFMTDFVSVIEKVISGKRQILNLSDEERQIEAVYQSGKALVATWVDIPYEMIGLSNTIFADEERSIQSKSDYFNMLMVYLAGTAATEAIYGERYSIASDDLKRAKELAYRMVEEYSMGESIFPDRSEAEDIMVKALEEVAAMLAKLESVRKDMANYLLTHENIRQEEARELLREIF